MHDFKEILLKVQANMPKIVFLGVYKHLEV